MMYFSASEDPSDDAGKTEADHLGRGRTWQTTHHLDHRVGVTYYSSYDLCLLQHSLQAVDSVAQLWGRELKSSNILGMVSYDCFSRQLLLLGTLRSSKLSHITYFN